MSEFEMFLKSISIFAFEKVLKIVGKAAKSRSDNADLQNVPRFVFARRLCSVYKPERLDKGGPLFNVKTEPNEYLRSTTERGPSLVGSLSSSCHAKTFLSCLGCSSQPSSTSTKCFFSSPRTFSL